MEKHLGNKLVVLHKSEVCRSFRAVIYFEENIELEKRLSSCEISRNCVQRPQLDVVRKNGFPVCAVERVVSDPMQWVRLVSLLHLKVF